MDLVNAIPKAIRKQENIVAKELYGYKCISDRTVFPPVVMMPGGFCLSFPLECQGRPKQCLRLWWDDEARKKNLEHIQRVSLFFNANTIKYTIPYKYTETALKISDSTIIPGVIMDWVEGHTLMTYVRENYRNSSLMHKLASNFYQMVQYHHEYNISHGDLSDENIIVGPTGELCLIDYDSFYIKNWDSNIKQSTTGVGWYQHPERMKNSNLYLNYKMDYFSQQVLYLSLLVIAECPQLFNPDTEKGLLFKEEDFKASSFQNRDIFQKVLDIKDSEIHNRLLELEKSLKSNLEEVKSIIDFPNAFVIANPLANYCGTCRHHFENQTDLYCPDCGTKRVTL